MKSKNLLLLTVSLAGFNTSCSLFGFMLATSHNKPLEVSIIGVEEMMARNRSSIAKASISGGSGYYLYQWWVDDVLLDGSSSEMVFGELLPGHHGITVAVTDINTLKTDEDTIDFEVLDYQVITLTEDPFTIAWNASGEADIVGYSVFIRTFGAEDWLLLESIEASETTTLTIEPSEIDAGEWEFGVLEVDTEGTESAIHSSLDPNAIPTSGWYLEWRG